jgi:hypothetical protein
MGGKPLQMGGWVNARRREGYISGFIGSKLPTIPSLRISRNYFFVRSIVKAWSIVYIPHDALGVGYVKGASGW